MPVITGVFGSSACVLEYACAPLGQSNVMVSFQSVIDVYKHVYLKSPEGRSIQLPQSNGQMFGISTDHYRSSSVKFLNNKSPRDCCSNRILITD